MVLVSLPEERWLPAVEQVAGIDVIIDPLTGPMDRSDEVEIVIPPYLHAYDRSLLTGRPNLRLVQLLTAGYDGWAGVLPAQAQLANATGVHDASTAELAVGLALASLRQFPEFVQAAPTGAWAPDPFRPALADSRVLLVGYGSIGRAIAARLAPFEVSISAVASRARTGDELVRQVHGIDELPTLLPKHNVVILIVPLTESTRGLVDDDFLAQMPDGAVLVNVARGAVADTEALLRHAGRVRLALDVTDPEPLPADHPLWQVPGILISQHTGGATDAFWPRAGALIADQLTRYVAGEPLRNLVTP